MAASLSLTDAQVLCLLFLQAISPVTPAEQPVLQNTVFWSRCVKHLENSSRLRGIWSG